MYVSPTWSEPQATQHKGHSPPTVAISCHCTDVLSQVSDTCHEDSQEMPPPWEKVCGQWDVPFASCCFPKGKGTDFLALTKWVFTVEQPGMHRAWSWQSGTWVQSLGNTTAGKSNEFSVAQLISHARRRGQLSMFLFKSKTALKVSEVL